MKRYGLLALALMVMCVQIAAADILYDNTGKSADPGIIDTATQSRWYGEVFTTGADSYVLSSVTLLMKEMNPGGANVSIYDNYENKPNSSIGNLLSPVTFSSSLALTTFGGNGIVLNPNSSYWVVLSATSPGKYDWAVADRNLGLQESYAKYADNSWTTPTGTPFIMLVEASPVPEPTSLLLLGSGIGVLGLAAWRKRK